MNSLAACLIKSVILMVVGLLAMYSFPHSLPDWIHLVWLLALSFGVGNAVRDWSVAAVAPLAYVVFLAAADASSVGSWNRLLPWNWLDTAGEDLTIFLLAPIGLAALIGSRIRLLPRGAVDRGITHNASGSDSGPV